MSQNIVGIRYVGLKDMQEDTVTNSGATWVKGQVNNFSDNLAKELLVHTDSFELAEPDANADTYMGKKTAGNHVEPVAFVNLNSMDAAQLATFARLQFSRVINLDDGRSIEALRSEVHGYMTNNNLDLEAESKRALAKGLILEKEVSAAEFKAVMAGTLALKLVPVFGAITPAAEPVKTVASPVEAKTVDVSTQAINNTENTTDLNATPNATVSAEPLKPVAEIGLDAQNQPANTNPTQTLNELVTSLEKPALIALAKQEGVAIANTMNVDQLRAKLLRDLANKAPAGL